MDLQQDQQTRVEGGSLQVLCLILYAGGCTIVADDGVRREGVAIALHHSNRWSYAGSDLHKLLDLVQVKV